MQNFLKFLTSSLLVCLLIATFAGCSRKFSDDPRLSIVHDYVEDEIKSLDPANAYDAVSLNILPNIMETLYQYDYLAAEYRLVPLLAADMPTFSKDRLTVTIRLKHGIRFQDDPCFKETQGKGREVKASDFIYEFKRIALPSLQSSGWWIFDGKIAGINAFHDKLVAASKADLPRIFEEPVEGLRALDDYTIQLKLVKPYPQVLYILAMSFTAPVPPEAVAAYGDGSGNITDHPIGTGPFILRKWDRNRRVELERNPTHHEEFYPTEAAPDLKKQGLLADAGKMVPFVDRVIFDIIKERQPAWLNFMNGTLDTLKLPKDNFQQAIVRKGELTPELVKKGVRLSVVSGTSFYNLTFNARDPLLKNKSLRQALSSAIDRDKWIGIFTNNTGEKMINAIPYGIQDRPRTDRIKYDFDLKRARTLLAQAGYPEGRGLPVIKFDMRGADTLSRQLGEFFTQQFDQIGVKVEVIFNTFPAFLEKSKQGNLQLSYGGWTLDYPDPENVYQLFYGPNKSPGPNDSNFDHAGLNRLYEQMAVMDPGPKRAALVQKMEDIVQEECPWAYGYYYTEYRLTQPWLENFRGGELYPNAYKYLRINKELKPKR